MKLDLILGVGITLVIMVMNAPIVSISIAYAGSNNSLFSAKNDNLTSLVTSNSTTIPTISTDQLPPEALITIKNIKNGFHFQIMMVQHFRTEKKCSHQSL